MMTRILTESVAMLGMLLLQMGCASPDEQPPVEAWHANDTTYVFEEPDSEFELDSDLEEISGLTFLDDGTIGAVQDEDGDLFVLDPSTGEVIDVRKFKGGGDYEGIERADNGLHVLRSDGRVYSMTTWNADELDSESFDHDVPNGCDAEGFAYQPSRSRFLIACKGDAGKGLKGMKAIYAFDAASNELNPEPAYLLDVDNFEASIEDHPLNEAVRSMFSDRLDMSGFRPSGLAVHPRTGDVYILSSATKAVLRLDDAGAVTAVWSLSDELFEQPEGIAFDSNGDVYISNEAGSRGQATLLKFRERAEALTSGSVMNTD